MPKLKRGSNMRKYIVRLTVKFKGREKVEEVRQESSTTMDRAELNVLRKFRDDPKVFGIYDWSIKPESKATREDLIDLMRSGRSKRSRGFKTTGIAPIGEKKKKRSVEVASGNMRVKDLIGSKKVRLPRVKPGK